MRLKAILFLFFYFVLIKTFAQQSNDCTIKNYLNADGTMYFYAPADTFYYTKAKELMGGMATDKENYFLVLQPFPKATSVGKKKEYKPLTVTLSNDSTFNLEFFDARFVYDSLYVILYLFDSKKNKAFLNNNIEKIYLQTPFIDETYNLKLHKDAVIQHIRCLNSIKKIM